MAKHTLPPDEYDAVLPDCLEALRGLSRESAVRLCVTKSGLAWVRKADRDGVLETVCLGRFDLVNPERPDLPWPAVMFVLSRPEVPGAPAACCAVAVYMGPDGDWEASAREPAETSAGRRLLIDWTQWRGDPDGPEGMVNGEMGRLRLPDPDAVPSEPTPGTLPSASTPGTPMPGMPGASPEARLSEDAALLKLRIVDRLLRWLDAE